MQDLSETRVTKLNALWSRAAKIETETLGRSADFLNHLISEIPRNDPLLDSMMFARHNGGHWQEPGDFVFEASPVWHDQDGLAVDELSQVFLRNLLVKSKANLAEQKRSHDQKLKELENGRNLRRSIREGKDKRDEVEVVRSMFTLQEAAHNIERSKITSEVEISTITSAVGDVSIGTKSHDFRSQTFKIPTNCDLCGDRIWGLSAKGFDCKDCGYTCHSKCELKVPADCPGEQNKDEKKKLKATRQESAHQVTAPPANGAAGDSVDHSHLDRSDTVNSMNTLSSGYSATAQRSVSGGLLASEDKRPEPDGASKGSIPAGRKNRVVAPPPSQYIKSPIPIDEAAPSKPGTMRAKMLYSFQPRGEGEISVDEGTEVIVLDPDGR